MSEDKEKKASVSSHCETLGYASYELWHKVDGRFRRINQIHEPGKVTFYTDGILEGE